MIPAQIINNYETWLNELSVIKSTIGMEEIEPVIGKSIIRLIDLIHGYSYGEIIESHYDESFEIAKDLAFDTA